jgi:hypothetical protein
MKRFPIELACYLKYCGISPKEEWRLALYRVNVRSTSVNYLVRHHRVHGFTVNWLRMQKRWKANYDREKNNPKRGEAKLASRPMSWHTHHSAD